MHNGAGRRGKRPKKGDTDLAALLRSIAHERIEVSHPVTGKPLTVVEGLTRALVQTGFKDPKVGLAVLELMTRTGAVPVSAPEQMGTADGDAATLAEFVGRAIRQERARTTTDDEGTGGEEGR